MMQYPLAPNGVFWTVNGEGTMAGRQMAFIRLAGCSVGCRRCDTDYSVAERLDASQIAQRVNACIPENCTERWAWITGGEPLDHDIRELVVALHRADMNVALATSGHHHNTHRVQWLSVSPHDPAKWVQRSGDELKLVPSLNGFSLRNFEPHLESTHFPYRWVMPCDGVPESLDECKEFCRRHPEFRLGIQTHKILGVP